MPALGGAVSARGCFLVGDSLLDARGSTALAAKEGVASIRSVALPAGRGVLAASDGVLGGGGLLGRCELGGR